MEEPGRNGSGAATMCGRCCFPCHWQSRNGGCEPPVEDIQVSMCADEEGFKLSPHSSQALLFLAPFHVCVCFK